MEAMQESAKNHFKPLSYTKQREPITQAFVLRQINSNTLPDQLNMVAQQVARVQASLADLDGNYDENVLKDQSAFTALKELRCYQRALVDLCIDDKLEPEKLAVYLTRSHQDFVVVSDEIRRESERMLVDDWEADNGAEAVVQEVVDADSAVPEENKETTGRAKGPLLVKRDEFSYSLLEAMQLKRQMIQMDDEEQLNRYNARTNEIFRRLLTDGIVTQRMAQEILDRQTLEKIGIGNAQYLHRLLVSYRTQTLYAQQKFNLMREECEGFAKLVIELNQEKIDKTSVVQVRENIQRLVGYFQLDPNRVLDLILSSFQNNVYNLAYLDLIKEFGQKAQVTQLLGFKIQHALDVGKIGPDGLPTVDAVQSGSCSTPYQLVEQNIFDLAAMFIKYQVVDLEDLWPHIQSKMDPMPEDGKDEIDQLKDLQTKNSDYLYKLHDKFILNVDGFKKQMEEQQIEPKHLEMRVKRAKMHCNFKVRLLQSCIRVNDWATADGIVNGLYDGKFDLTWSRHVLDSIFKALDWCVTPLYRQISQASKVLPNRFGTGKFKLKAKQGFFSDDHPSSIKQASAFDENLLKDLRRVLGILGVYIALDEKVFQKVLKVVHHAMELNPSLKQNAIQLASEIFVPALSLVTTNFGIESGIWAIFKHADFQKRYTCYTNILKFTYLSQPVLISKQIEVYKKFSKWARRLVDSSDSRTKCKQFMRIGYGNCLLAFDLMVTNARSYENQIEAQISAIGMCQDLALDQMAFMIVKHLADTSDPMLDQNQNVAKWLMNLTDLASQFYKKYSQVDMIGLLTYLIHKLRDENSFVFSYMINQIVAKISGWNDLVANQLQPDQLNILSAGCALIQHSQSNQSQAARSNKKQIEALKQLFWHQETNDHQKIGVRLMVQLAQQAQYVGQEFDTQHLILVARQYDKMQVYFTHMVDTLQSLEQSQKKFAQLLPENPSRSLSFDYRLPPQHVFQVMRCALPPIYKLTADEFTEKVGMFKEVLDLSSQTRIDAALSSQNTIDNDYWDEMTYVTTKKEELWKHLKPEFYAIFWYMNLQSLIVPEKLYKDQIKVVTDQIKDLNSKNTSFKSGRASLDAAMRSQSYNSENDKEKIKKNQKEIERLTKVQRDLQKELEFLLQQHKGTQTFLKQTIPDLFRKEGSEEAKKHITDLSTVLIQHCFFPRLMHSAKDALFSFHFFKLLHKLRVPNFNFLGFFGQITRQIVPAIHFCSEDEADNLGIFFLELFKQLQHWSKKDVWQRECHGYGGFAREYVDPSKCIALRDFEKIIATINKRISAAMIFCFDKTGKNQVKARCALIILNRVHSVFPNKYEQAKLIQQQLQVLVDAGDSINQDLKTLAGRLNEKMRTKVSSYPEHAEKNAVEEAKQRVQNAKVSEETKSRHVTSSQNNGSSQAPSGRDRTNSHSRQEKGSSSHANSSRQVQSNGGNQKTSGGNDDTKQKPGGGSSSASKSQTQKDSGSRDKKDHHHDRNSKTNSSQQSNQRKVTEPTSGSAKEKESNESRDAQRRVVERKPQGGDFQKPSQSSSKTQAKAQEKTQHQRDKVDPKPSNNSKPAPSNSQQSSKQQQSSSSGSTSQAPQASKQPREETKKPAPSDKQSGSKRQAQSSTASLAATISKDNAAAQTSRGSNQSRDKSKSASAERESTGNGKTGGQQQQQSTSQQPSGGTSTGNNKRQRTENFANTSKQQASTTQMSMKDNESMTSSGAGNKRQEMASSHRNDDQKAYGSSGSVGKQSNFSGSSNQQQDRGGAQYSRTSPSGGDHGRHESHRDYREGGRDHHGGAGGHRSTANEVNRGYDRRQEGGNGPGRDRNDGRAMQDRRSGDGPDNNRSPRRGNAQGGGPRGNNYDDFSPHAGGHDGGYHDGGQSKYYGGANGGGNRGNRKNN